MEFLTGVKEKETLEISQLLTKEQLGQNVKVNGAVHTTVSYTHLDVYKRQVCSRISTQHRAVPG